MSNIDITNGNAGQDARKHPYFQVDNEMWDKFAPRIGAYALAVYVGMCRYCGKDETAWPSLNTISKHLDISRPTVIKAIETLETYHLITITERTDKKGARTSNLYTIIDVEIARQKCDRQGLFNLPPVNDVDNPCKSSLQPPVNDVDSKNIHSEQDSTEDSFPEIQTSLISDEFVPESIPFKAKEPKPTLQGFTTNKLAKAKWYFVHDAKATIYNKGYDTETKDTKLSDWAKLGAYPVLGKVIASDPKYASFTLVNPPKQRNVVFDAFAVCAWNMPQGFNPDQLSSGGQIGKLVGDFAAYLGKTFNDLKDDQEIADKICRYYKQWTQSKPTMDKPRSLAAWLSWWSECELRFESDEKPYSIHVDGEWYRYEKRLKDYIWYYAPELPDEFYEANKGKKITFDIKSKEWVAK